MSTPQLDDILSVPTQDTVLNQEVYPQLKSRAVRITDWLVGGVYRAMAYVIAAMRVNVRIAIAAFTAATFEDYVFGVSTPPPNEDGSVIDVTGYAPVVAQQRYGLTQIAASYTLRNLTLTNVATTSYGPIQPGDFMVSFPSGNRYVNNVAFTIPAAVGITPGVVVVQFRSELTTNTTAGLVYNDPTGSAIALVTSSYPGVSASNPLTNYSAVSQTGASVGTVAPAGTPDGTSHTVAVRIDGSGNAGDSSVAWSTQVDTLGWVTQSGAGASNLGGFGIGVALSDNGGAPAFPEGIVYYFDTPGSDITQVGADVETPQQLGTRCRGLIPALSFPKDQFGQWIPASPTADAYTTLVLNASSQVRIVYIETGIINNQLFIVIAGQGGTPLPAGVVATVQAFLNSFAFLTDLPVVTTSVPRAITLGGLTITAKASQLGTAQSALTLRLKNYLGGVDPAAALNINGIVDYDYLIALVRTTPGVLRVAGTLTINGGTTDFQLPVTPGAFESASWSQPSSTAAFAWASG